MRLTMVMGLGFVLVAATGRAAEPSKGQRADKPDAAVKQASAVCEVVKHAEAEKDGEADLVAARMLAKVKEPVVCGERGGKLAKGGKLADAAAKLPVQSAATLIEQAKATPAGKGHLAPAIAEAAKTADTSMKPAATYVCLWGYCYGVFGCWVYCY